jgi:predicted small lipoprotein YifL
MCRGTGTTFGTLILAIASLFQLSGCGSNGTIAPPPNIVAPG